jgi:general stress protein 26
MIAILPLAAGSNEKEGAMAEQQPQTHLDRRFSSDGATAVAWSDAREQLERAEVFWLSTVRPDGQPHVTPLIAAWLDNLLYFCTGGDERKAKNLAAQPRCTITTGCNAFSAGLDLVIEGEAQRITDNAILQRVSDRYVEKYGPDWRFAVRDGLFIGGSGNEALVFVVEPRQVFGFGRGETFSQTRWRFA